MIAGLTRFVKSGHIARAVLEATAFQSREVVDAMNADSGVPLEALKVDGGMVVNETLMQFQADMLGVPVIRPVVTETTALGARTPLACRRRVGASTTCASTGRGPALGAADGGGAREELSTSGRRPSSGPSTGRKRGRAGLRGLT